MNISEALDKAESGLSGFTTLYNQIKDAFAKTSRIEETPRAGWPEGTNQTNTNLNIDRAAEVVKEGVSFYEQVKGLFGLGYEPTEPQPASPVKTATQPATTGGKTDVTILVIIGVLLLLFLR